MPGFAGADALDTQLVGKERLSAAAATIHTATSVTSFLHSPPPLSSSSLLPPPLQGGASRGL